MRIYFMSLLPHKKCPLILGDAGGAPRQTLASRFL
jgi:hypothetical protein